METWRPLHVRGDHYSVSDFGNLRGPRGHNLAGYIDRYGYRCVCLGTRGDQTTVKIHRAVALAFIGPIPEGMHVNHKNGVKTDNRLANLEIVTASENVSHGYRELGRPGANYRPTKGATHHNAKLSDDDVREIRRLYERGATQTVLAAMFGTPQTNISRIVRRTAWSHI